ncbi:MAG: XRE family transcriptional regulator [Gammaproteobacteria bacterium]|nr:XRE family transcriptional regulator [Gammaproteobacteria bacterium]MBK7727746.1 XRE family transcriptional regulator [Gammaproteobacteria bacterium]
MATQLGVGEWTVGNWENDETKPILRFIPRIISFLGYNPDLPNPTTTAEHLKSKRRALGWSQKQAARHLGVDPDTWSNWECGGAIRANVHQRRVADFLGLSESRCCTCIPNQAVE